jgi:hypothetical protein
MFFIFFHRTFLKTFFGQPASGIFGFALPTSQRFAKPKEPLIINAEL